MLKNVDYVKWRNEAPLAVSGERSIFIRTFAAASTLACDGHVGLYPCV